LATRFLWQLLGKSGFPEKTTDLCIDLAVIARMEVINLLNFFVEEYAEHFPFT